jgi:alpha-tubulin suppressor-like RCC1 family protein
MARIARLSTLVVALIVVACGKDNPAGPPTVATVVVTPGADTLLTLGRTRQFTAVARDASGNPVNGVTLVWSSSNPAVATVDASTGIVTAVGNGLSIIRADAGGVMGQATLAVAQFVANVLVTPGTAGLATVGVTQQYGAVAKDSSNATVAGVRFVWQSSDPSVAIVDTTGLALSKGPGQTTITATGRGTPGNATLTVTQAAAALVFSVPPTNAIAGEAVNPAIQVEVRDGSGHLLAGDRRAITLAFGANPGSALLHGSTTVNAVGGIATFSGITIETADSGYTLSASASGTPSATSPSFFILPAASARLRFVQFSVTDTAGQSLPFEVHVTDRFGNVTPGAVGAVFVRISTNPTGAALINGNFSFVVTNGIADLSLLSIQKSGFGYRFVATGSGGVAGLDSAFSGDLTVNPASPTILAFTQQPGFTFLGDNLLPSLVRPQDQFGNSTGTATTITLTVGVNPWGGALIGTSTKVGSGALTFDSLRLDKPGVGYTIIATAAGLTPDTTNAFTVIVPITSTGEAAGVSHSCVLVSGGYPACWGDNSLGQVGRPSGGFDSIPRLVTGRRAFTQLTAGDRHTCGLEAGGAAWCWGENLLGQLGNAATGAKSVVPVLVDGGLQFASLSAGGTHTCGVTTGGVAYCWGNNASGQLGDSGKVATFTPTPTAVYGALTYRAVAAGLNHTCAIAADSTPRCWGDDAFGQLGDSALTTSGSDTAVVVRGGLHARRIAAGASHSCANTAAGAFCWGRNNHGQLGNTNLGVNSDKPVAATSGGALGGQLVAGGDHTCAINSTSTLFCWGSNAAGELGNGLAPTDGDHPLQVSTPGGAASFFVGAGATHTCATVAGLSGSKVYCWGSNAVGQLGDGTRTNRSVPAAVKEQ